MPAVERLDQRQDAGEGRGRGKRIRGVGALAVALREAQQPAVQHRHLERRPGVEGAFLDGADELERSTVHGRPEDGRGTGRQSGGASSKPAKSKPGATVQPTSVHAPRLVADCQWPAGTTT